MRGGNLHPRTGYEKGAEVNLDVWQGLEGAKVGLLAPDDTVVRPPCLNPGSEIPEPMYIAAVEDALT